LTVDGFNREFGKLGAYAICTTLPSLLLNYNKQMIQRNSYLKK